jgi:transposase InsO family protein
MLSFDNLGVASLSELALALDLDYDRSANKVALKAALLAHIQAQGLTEAQALALASGGPAVPAERSSSPTPATAPTTTPPAPTSSLGGLQLAQPGPFNVAAAGRRTRWQDFVEEVDLFLTASGAAPTHSQKAALLLHCAGPDLRQLIASLDRTPRAGEDTYAALLRVIKAKLSPIDTELYDRFALSSSTQRLGESTDDFLSRLRRAALLCTFTCDCGKSHLDQRILDILLAKTTLPGLRQRVFERGLRALPDVVNLARSMETARAHSTAMGDAAVADDDEHTANFASPTQRGSTGSARNSGKGAAGRQSGQSTVKASEQPNSASPAPATACQNCGSSHTPPRNKQCPAWGKACSKCDKLNHFAVACRATRAAGQANLTYPDEDDDAYQCVFAAGREKFRAHGTVMLEGNIREMLLDTGASCNVVPSSFLHGEYTMTRTPPLRVFGRDQTVQPLGATLLNVSRPGSQPVRRTFLVVPDGHGPALLGLNLCMELGFLALTPGAVVSAQGSGAAVVDAADAPLLPTTGSPALTAVIHKFPELFGADSPGIVGVKAHIDIAQDAVPVKLRARHVPLAIRPAVVQGLDAMVARGTLIPTPTSKWASPTVNVAKPDGEVRICADYTATVARVINTETYPLPRPVDIFGSLAEAKVFSTLDLRCAYEQLDLDEASRDLLTIATCRGLMRYARMPYGISSAPAVLQRTMDTLLSGIPEAHAYCDDIIVATRDMASHAEVLQTVLARLSQHNVRLKATKCKIGQSSLHFLGFILSAEVRKVDPERIRAIVEMPPPSSVPDLRAFLGCVRFYDSFVKDLATLAGPLHQLLKKDTAWEWGKVQAHAFECIKRALTSAPTLVHFDPSLPLVLSTDASPYGVAAVLAHRYPDDSERPIAYAARTLTSAEKNYAHIDKEALAIMFAAKKFVTFLWATPFTLKSDAKPLLAIFGSKKGLPDLVTARMHRYAIALSAFKFTVEHRKGIDNGNADALSRLPIPATADDGAEDSVFLLHTPEQVGAIAWKDVKSETDKDAVLARVRSLVRGEFPRKCPDDDVQPYWRHRDAISVHDGVLRHNDRVILPPSLRPRYLADLHAAHQGATKMKALASNLVFWPGLNAAIVDTVAACNTCQRHQADPPRVFSEFVVPAGPWSRVHVDFFSFGGADYLLLVDASTKWLEVSRVTSTTATATLKTLSGWFARFGMPDALHSDGGPQFTSQEFGDAMVKWGINHTVSAAYHPESNGQAERAVRTVKEGLTKAGPNRLNDLLFRLRCTPDDGVSPHEALTGRRMRSTLSVGPVPEDAPPRPPAAPKFPAGSRVWARILGPRRKSAPKWIEANVRAIISPSIRSVAIGDGLSRRHVNQLRLRVAL